MLAVAQAGRLRYSSPALRIFLSPLRGVPMQGVVASFPRAGASFAVMANILLIDPSDLARKAMRGYLARAGHRLVCAASGGEARDLLRRHVAIDLVFLEVKLEGGTGFDFVDAIRAEPLLAGLPMVFYTAAPSRDHVLRALQCKVQNFLLKPYQEDVVYAEVHKAVALPWRERHFRPEAAFCRESCLTPEQRRTALERLARQFETDQPVLRHAVSAQADARIKARLAELTDLADEAGAPGLSAWLAALRRALDENNWPALTTAVEQLDFPPRLIRRVLFPDDVPEIFLDENQLRAREEEKLRVFWRNAPQQERCPVVTPEQMQRQLDQLPGAPVAETAAAAFQMAANGDENALLSPLMELVDRDPGLAAQVLLTVNALNTRDPDDAPVENPQLAVSLLGEQRLVSLARSIDSIEERWMQLPPLTWSQFWTFQVGMGHMARYVCHFLEFDSLQQRAYTAGLLHDLGKLLLVRLQPIGFQVIVTAAREQGLPLRTVERQFLGWTTPEIGAWFGEKHGLPRGYCEVMRWLDHPELATEERDLVGVVALARELCLRNHLGDNGEPRSAAFLPLEDTPAWQVMRERAFFGFNLKKFEAKVQARCVDFKREITGRFSVPHPEPARAP